MLLPLFQIRCLISLLVSAYYLSDLIIWDENMSKAVMVSSERVAKILGD